MDLKKFFYDKLNIKDNKDGEKDKTDTKKKKDNIVVLSDGRVVDMNKVTDFFTNHMVEFEKSALKGHELNKEHPLFEYDEDDIDFEDLDF